MIVPEIDDDKESGNYVSNYNYHLMCQKSNHHSYYNQMPILCLSLFLSQRNHEPQNLNGTFQKYYMSSHKKSGKKKCTSPGIENSAFVT
jgi:hypothetical protein